MAFTSRTILSRRAIDDITGDVIFEFHKQVVRDDGKVINTEPHLLSVPPIMADNSLPDWPYIRRQVDASLDSLGFEGITDEAWNRVTGFADIHVTADVVYDYFCAQSAREDSVLSNPAVQEG